ncbi:hypothetical protein [Nocardia blacklockiae]|uniref:hypothetical protein n=1 Tax=Nocardia blacklockiae TaxID=480036 RepID=UPI0018953EF9|nr:hypothetical protein [Nocardia blacklockiae]MBF6172291.1 hypothetical protein [Nocardia blacklockiae]
MTNSPDAADWAPDACTLPTAEQPTRVAEFGRFFAESVRRVHRVTPTSLELTLAAEAEPVARDLAARESSCCSFFRFEFISTDADSVMRVEVPDSYAEVLDAFAAQATAARGEPQ